MFACRQQNVTVVGFVVLDFDVDGFCAPVERVLASQRRRRAIFRALMSLVSRLSALMCFLRSTPREGDRELARKDIERLISAGVDGFQIDSTYFDLVPRSKKQVP